MKKLKLVKQYDKYGCTIACLGMIINKSYFDTRKLIYEKKIKEIRTEPEYIGIYEHHLIGILLNHFNINSKWIKFKSLSYLKKHCILFVIPKDPNGLFRRHCIVYDALNKKILDPFELLNNKLIDYNVCYCLEIQCEN